MHNPSTRFEDILDDYVTAIQEQRKTVAECLAQYPDLREELEPLLRLTVRLQAARTLQASPELRRVSPIRVRNLVAAWPRRVERAITIPNLPRVVYRRLQAVFSTWRKLPAAVTIGVVFAAWLLVGGGVVYASTDALPGDVLYPVKRTVESMQLAVSRNDASDARLHLAFASMRLDEVAALLEKGRPQDIEPVLADYEAQVRLVLSFFSYDRGLSPDEQATLADLLVTAQAHHEAQLLTTSRAAHDQALEVLAGEPTPTVSPTPPPVPTQLPTEPSTPTPVPTQPPTEPSAPTAVPTQPPTELSTATPVPTTPPTEPPTPTPVATQPPTPTPSPEPTEWPTSPGWPTEWPTPANGVAHAAWVANGVAYAALVTMLTTGNPTASTPPLASCSTTPAPGGAWSLSRARSPTG
jgi:hypothetical protein